MGGCLGQTVHRCDHIFSGQPACFEQGLPGNEFGQSRRARHGRDAPFGLESNLIDPIHLHLQAKTNHVAADRVLDLPDSIGLNEIAHVSRMLKMIE